ncbi:MAG: hypothetical protein DDT33_00665 [Firmicutes bacterium]|nr:hypothetical protein [Bacillota bacterium]
MKKKKRRGKPEKKDQELFTKAIETYPIILILIEFLKDVYQVFDSRASEALDNLIQKYRESDVDTLAQYVKGLADDYEAVKTA